MVEEKTKYDIKIACNWSQKLVLFSGIWQRIWIVLMSWVEELKIKLSVPIDFFVSKEQKYKIKHILTFVERLETFTEVYKYVKEGRKEKS